MSSESSRTVVFAGGGTAGHVEPALAVAGEWRGRHPNDRCIFIGTLEGLENLLVPAAGFELRTIPKVVMPHSFSSFNVNLLRLPWQLRQAVQCARTIISQSTLVIGFGGYVSAPAYLAARIEKIPIVIHEANTKIGWANRLGACFTRYLAIANPVSKGKFANAQRTGLPLSADIQAAIQQASRNWDEARVEAKRRLGWNLDQPTLLILGGSQGSVSINAQIEEAMPALTSRGVQILHSVGAKNVLPQSTLNYRATAYINDMATAYLAADLIIARSGAVTCAEVSALGRMAIFIPLPIGNGEQARNADYLVAAGRAIVLSQREFTPGWLNANLDAMLVRSSKNSSEGLSDNLDAAKKIVELMESALTGVRA